MRNYLPDGTYFNIGMGCFDHVIGGVVRARYGDFGRDISIFHQEKPKVEEIELRGTIVGNEAQFVINADSGVISGFGYINPPKRKWSMWNHHKSVRDNLALIERGQGLVGFTVDENPACAFFDKDGIFKVSSGFADVSGVETSSLKEVVAFLDGRVGY